MGKTVLDEAYDAVAEDLGVSVTTVRRQLSRSSWKGRKAEVYVKMVLGDDVVDDLNDHMPNAPYDLLSRKYGRVNVKASRRWHYKSKSRRKNPHYWKFSATGIGHCDTVIAVFYGARMDNVLRVLVVNPILYAGKSLTITGLEQMEWPKELVIQ